MSSTPNTPRIKVPLLTASPSRCSRTGDEPPAVLSYFAMRRAAGYIGFALPLIVVLFDHWQDHCIPSSISASYYTFVRNAFVGGLCSVGIFLITSIGYKQDRPYSIFAGAMAFIVAFCPTIPDSGCALPGAHIPFDWSHKVHILSAVLLFLTFAWFCLVLFCRSPRHPGSFIPRLAGLPRQKKKRNITFILCGSTMVVAMLYYAIVLLMRSSTHPEPHYALLVVEWICLWAFALAWLVKGQQLFKD